MYVVSINECTFSNYSQITNKHKNFIHFIEKKNNKKNKQKSKEYIIYELYYIVFKKKKTYKNIK